MNYRTMVVAYLIMLILGLWTAYTSGRKEKQFEVVGHRLRLLPVSSLKRIVFVASILIYIGLGGYLLYRALGGYFDR
ncbi:MAG: hypothetical protein P4N41_07830 [Negativicutes bacterium]|nr:hypothetical protein [Negativicutes bacterium]